MDFFAIVGGQPQSVYRLDLHQDLQLQLDENFACCSDQFLNPDLVVVPFERENFQPDETEILEVNPFDLPALISDATANPVGWPVLPADDGTISRVSCVFAFDSDKDRLIFQVINKSQRLTTTNVLNIVLRGNVFSRLTEPGLILSNTCHALYEGGALRFRSMWWLKQIFDIKAYYRAATEADLETFANLENVHVENLDSLRTTSGQWVRTRIAYIVDSGVLRDFSPRDLITKASGFDIELTCVVEDGQEKLVIPEASHELRTVLKFLEEELYEGVITGAKFEANSKRRR